MLSDWTEVETLIRELGAVRGAAFATHASDACYLTIEDAIAKATQAVVVTIDDPRNAAAVGDARRAIVAAHDLIAGLASEIERARRARDRAAELGVKRRQQRDGDPNS